jgi:hypothetical protein
MNPFFVHKNHSVLIRQQRCRKMVSLSKGCAKYNLSLQSYIKWSIFLNSGKGIFSADMKSQLSVLTSSVEPRCCESICVCFPSLCKLGV